MQPIGRFSYLFCGLLLMIVKFAIDALAARSYGQNWSPLIYWSPIHLRLPAGAAENQDYLLTLALIAVPFTAIGIWLTLRRLKTLRLARWLSFLFFLPVVNLIFFFFLVISPEFAPTAGSSGKSGWMPAVFQEDSLTALLASCGVAAVSASIAVGLSITAFQSYGWGVFFAVPFGIGVLTTLLVSIPARRSFSFCVGVSCFALALTGATLLAFAFEGIVCLIMSVPLAIPLTILGVFVAREIADPGHLPAQSAMFAFLTITLCPLSAANEKALPGPQELFEVVTSLEVDAPPATVWNYVIAFPELAPPDELLFRGGIAYPIRARIEGSGPGAIRYCEFSTGPFVEPITTWQAPHLLAFNVTSSPTPMRELSPYEIHPPHLDGFLQSKRGQFRLIPINQGRRTRLEGTTWYEQSLYPAGYWRAWTDWIIHKIHLRVLQHIRSLSESQVGLN
jgi:hypothetical protein